MSARSGGWLLLLLGRLGLLLLELGTSSPASAMLR
jgi:hypothetical protein